MEIEIITNPDRFQELEQEWNRLLEKSASHVPFLRHEFLTSWWQTLGGGEWEQGELFILAARDHDGQLEGIAPLFLNDKSLMFIGTHEIADYLDVIVNENHLSGFANAIFAALEEKSGSWEVLDLYNLVQGSPTLAHLKELAQKRGWDYREQILQPAPCILLADSWESYLDNLESKYRHEIERKLRRAEGYFLPVEWYFVNDKNHLDEEIDAFLELMAYHPQKAEFLTDLMETQLRKSVHSAFQEGWAKLAFLTVGGEKAAGYLNFDFDNRIWVYNSGINPLFENISPGWVLLSYQIQWAIQEGRDSFDFMRGDESYKYHFGGDNRYVIRATIRQE